MKANWNQLQDFCDRWLAKARRYDETNLSDYFDRFTTHYILFNAIYNEVGFRMRQPSYPKQMNKDWRKYALLKPFAPLPDKALATRYVVEYYGKDALRNSIAESENCLVAVNTLVDLIETEQFYFHLDYETGQPDWRKDKALARRCVVHDPQAILELIYQARCNLFHGQKEYEQSQRTVLRCLTTLLEFISQKVLLKLLADLKNGSFTNSMTENFY